MSELYRLLASVPRGFADLLAIELQHLGAKDIRERGNAVQFTGDLRVAYRACRESWLASRIYLEIARLEAPDAEAFYQGLRALDWSRHIDPDGTLACEFTGQHPAINNSHFGALRIKDAICDSLRERYGRRPNIAAEQPDVRIHVHAYGLQLTVSVDLAGDSLHRRGWRSDSGVAPLRENVAAGVLLRAGWPSVRQQGGVMFDPMCGVGTLVIEAARMAKGEAAGAHRQYFGFLGWRGHDPELWQSLTASAVPASAMTAGDAAATKAPQVVAIGCDRDRRRVSAAREHARRAGVEEWARFEVGDLTDTIAPPVSDIQSAGGLVCTNPPWGIRLEDREGARAVHQQLGVILREHFQGWQAAILTGDATLGLELGMRARRVHTVFNGAVECRLLRFDLTESSAREMRPTRQAHPRIDLSLVESPGAQMLANRLRKNQKQLAAWLSRDDVHCYRLYDADMPEYAFAIDVYRGSPLGVEATQAPISEPSAEQTWLMVQEYAAPPQIPEETLRKRRNEALAGLVSATGVAPEQVRLRTRRRRKRGEQYERSEIEPINLQVKENNCLFIVSLGEYLDTGLFLDHRPIRQQLSKLASGKRLLNLFAYTGSVSVQAAVGGALSTTSVDLSGRYLEWAQDNFRLNGLVADFWRPPLEGRSSPATRPPHALIQADVREWLQAESIRPSAPRYDLIFCDPPTFSNSKRMQGVLDVQRDHAQLIAQCMQLLAPAGLLVFSTNAQRFQLDPNLAVQFVISDISRRSLPPDFARNSRIHQCFEIRSR
jgi:23S rRNA (guanine2445-N2)-methyltransferase / 23S rRNA (guanine2069-N7)-methyltransferase